MAKEDRKTRRLEKQKNKFAMKPGSREVTSPGDRRIDDKTTAFNPVQEKKTITTNYWWGSTTKLDKPYPELNDPIAKVSNILSSNILNVGQIVGAGLKKGFKSFMGTKGIHLK